jgi:signal transduction histidine kinase
MDNLQSAEVLVQLIRHLGHDMRAPLGALISTTDMLLTGVYDPLNERQTRAAERMGRNGRRTLAMLDDFVTFIKAQAGELVLTARPFEPRVRLLACCERVHSVADEKALTIVLETRPEVPQQLFGDEVVIERIILALLWNAVAYTTAGEIRVCSTWDAQTGWTIEVRDTGTGVTAEDAEHIFEPFWRGLERPQLPTAGAGLGLPMALALAQTMGGTLRLKQTGLEGSVFSVVLPLKAEVANS